MSFSSYARVTAELVGTAFLLMAVVGSGIMAERLCKGNVAVALLTNTIATGAALVALIQTFGPISRAHFNPPVTLADASQRGIPWREVPGYVLVQILGAFLGVYGGPAPQPRLAPKQRGFAEPCDSGVRCMFWSLLRPDVHTEMAR